MQTVALSNLYLHNMSVHFTNVIVISFSYFNETHKVWSLSDRAKPRCSVLSHHTTFTSDPEDISPLLT